MLKENEIEGIATELAIKVGAANEKLLTDYEKKFVKIVDDKLNDQGLRPEESELNRQDFAFLRRVRLNLDRIWHFTVKGVILGIFGYLFSLYIKK